MPRMVTGRGLLARIDAGTAPTIVDVRSRWEFTRGHVPGARHIPFWSLAARTSELSSSHPVVLYCGHGPRAYFAGAVLRLSGFRQIHYLEGHMRQWRRGGLREEFHG